ncbi:MAG: YfhO family protein [Chloroflexi bacterium]|nr:YfhO family protein [Chloroflexota bacterium]
MKIRKHWQFLTLWTLLCGLFFASFLLRQEHFSGGDATGQFYAFARFQAREMAQGRLPLWSPGSYAGFPFAADTQATVFYPLRWLTILFSLPWDFPYYALELETIVHVWLMGAFTYALGYALTQDRWAGLVGAVTFALGGFIVSYPISQLAILETYTWLPLVLLLLRVGVGRKPPLRWLMAAGLALAMSGLAGHPQSFLHVSYVAAAYYLFLAIRARWRWQWALGLGAMMAATTVGIMTVAWLPALRFLAFTVRSDVSYKFVSTGMDLMAYLQTLVPGSLGLASASYGGITAVLLAVLAWLGRKQSQRWAEITFWGATAVLALWLSLGDDGILFELAYRILPGFSLFRQQERLIAIFNFSLAMLAVQGMAFGRRGDAARDGLVSKATFWVFVGLGVTAVMLLAAEGVAFEGWRATWGWQWILALSSLFLLQFWPRKNWAALAIILLLVADLYRPALTAIERKPEPPPVYTPPAWAAVLQTESPQRLDSDNRAFANLGELYNVEDIRGISPLKPQAMADFEELPLTRRWRLLNVTHVLADSPPKGIETTPTAVPILHQFDNALPRAWMSYQPIAAPDAAAALEQLKTPDFDPATTVILHPPLPDLSQIAVPAQPPQVEIRRRQANALIVKATTETPGLLVVSEWFYPGWRATVDGEPVPIYPADYALQTIWLSPGAHTIELRFIPPDVIVGGVVSLLTLLAAGIVVWQWRPVTAISDWRLEIRDWKLPIFNLQPRISNLKGRWVILLIVALGFGLRIFLLGNQELRGDEAFSYLFALQPAAEITQDLLNEGDPHSPFHYLLLHGWMRLAGDSEFAMRFISLVPGVLLIPLLYRLGRLMSRERATAVLAAAFAAISPSLIWLSQDVRSQYTLAMFFNALATAILIQISALPRGQDVGRRHKSGRATVVRWWILYIIAADLSVYSHYYGVFALLAHGLYLLLSRRQLLWQWALSGVTAVSLFALWLIPQWPQIVSAGHVGTPSRAKLARHLAEMGVELTIGPALGGWLVRWLFLGAAGLTIVGARSLIKRRPGWAGMLIGWLGSAMLGIFLVRFNRTMFNNYYISAATPAWLLLVAAGIIALWRRGRWFRTTAVSSAALLVIASAMSLNQYYFNPDDSRTIGYRKIAAHIAAQAGPNEMFIAHFPDPSLDYYLKDVSIPRVMQPAKNGLPAAETEQALIQLAADYDRLWLVPAHKSVWDREDTVPRWLDYHTLREQQLWYDRLELVAYRPLHAVNALATPINLSLENGPILKNLFVTVAGLPAGNERPLTLPPEAILDITLIWETEQAIPENYTVFVHLLDDGGFLHAQHDGVPAQGSRPTTMWVAGEQVLDKHSMTIPPDVAIENGRIVVGMYQTETLERQLFTDGRDAAAVIEVQIER